MKYILIIKNQIKIKKSKKIVLGNFNFEKNKYKLFKKRQNITSLLERQFMKSKKEYLHKEKM